MEENDANMYPIIDTRGQSSSDDNTEDNPSATGMVVINGLGLGSLGVDRFIDGGSGVGFAKLISNMFGIGVLWGFVDWFSVMIKTVQSTAEVPTKLFLFFSDKNYTVTPTSRMLAKFFLSFIILIPILLSIMYLYTRMKQLDAVEDSSEDSSEEEEI